mgnify:FL=1
MSKSSRTGGELLVKCLANLGVKTGFGVPGESYLAVLDALYDADIKFTLCRHESAAGFAAAAWGKLTGQPGIGFVTRGPGATNASIGVHTAMQDSSPMILFIGQVAVDDKGREAFQEVDYRAFFTPLAKWATEIDNPDRIPEIISRAWHIALSGRPGPVVIALPEDMLTQMTASQPCQPVTIAEAGVDTDALSQAMEMLSAAKKPLILAGGGGWNDAGKKALQSFAESQNFPVSAAFRYHDVIDNHSPIYIGDAGVGMAPHIAAAIKQADVILALNIRLGEGTTQAWTLLDVPYASQKIIHVHASDMEIGKIYHPALALHAGPNQFAMALAGQVASDAQLASRKAFIDENRKAYLASLTPAAQDSPVDMSAVMAILQEQLAEDAILTNGAGNFALWPNKAFCFGPNQRLIAPQSGAMGYGLPAAIAAGVAYPGRQVVCFAGDGDIQMGIAELGTAIQANAKLIILVLNNGSYGTIRMHQERDYPNRISGTSLYNPDFAAVAQAYGMAGFKVGKTADFEAVFAKAAQADKGAVIELDINVDAITPRTTLAKLRGGA